MASLTNVSIFFAKFIYARLAHNTALSRLPVIVRTTNRRRLELFAAVPPALVPAGVKLRRSLDDAESSAAPPPTHHGQGQADGDSGSPAVAGLPDSSEALGHRLQDIGHEVPQTSSVDVQMITLSTPSAMPRPSADVEGYDRAASTAIVPAWTSTTKSGHQRSRLSFGLGVLQPQALAKDTVLVPLGSWAAAPVLSFRPLLWLRRLRGYQVGSLLASALVLASTLWAVWTEFDSAWLALCVIVITVAIEIIELTRWDRYLYRTLVRALNDCVLAAALTYLRTQLRQYEFHFVSFSTILYLVLSSMLRVRRATLRGEPAPVWLIASHCAAVSESPAALARVSQPILTPRLAVRCYTHSWFTLCCGPSARMQL
jgi:hypothetical protein